MSDSKAEQYRAASGLEWSHLDEWRRELVYAVRAAVREELAAPPRNDSRADYLTSEQAAILLQICPTSLEKARSQGRGPLATIPHHKIGRSVRYARADIVAAIARLRVAGRASKA